jgi:biopolymer transport protein ExbD
MNPPAEERIMAAARFDDTQPISDINTTPLVDVMLVLLIMFIITIPVTSHKVPVDLPQSGGGAPPAVHRLDLDAAGRLFWNGAAVDGRELDARLAAHVADPARPVLHMNTDAETRYERFDEVLAAVRRAGVTRLGFLGQDRFAGAI